MATSTNIDRFNVITLHLFSKLYESFPIPIEIELSKEAADLEERLVEGMEKEAAHSVVFGLPDFIEHTVGWLEQEGFLTVDARILSGDMYGVRLTNKGLSLMGRPASVEEPRKSIAERTKEALRSGSLEAVSETVKRLLEGAADWGTKAATSGAFGG